MLSYRYLAFRDFKKIAVLEAPKKFALDFGCGTGISANFLSDLGFDVLGVDLSAKMVSEARNNYPSIQFKLMDELDPLSSFDLVMSYLNCPQRRRLYPI